MLSDAEFSKRSEMYKARVEALERAQRKLQGINSLHKLWTFFTVLAGLFVLWLNPTVHWGIGLLVSLFLIRFAGNMLVRFRFESPEMERIDREFPAPPKLDHSGLS